MNPARHIPSETDGSFYTHFPVRDSLTRFELCAILCTDAAFNYFTSNVHATYEVFGEDDRYQDRFSHLAPLAGEAAVAMATQLEQNQTAA